MRISPLDPGEEASRIAADMKLIYAYIVWGGMATALGTGVWLSTVKHMHWPLALCFLAFVVGVGKIGCKTH